MTSKIIIEKAALKAMVNACCKVIRAKNANPEFDNILIQAYSEENKLRMVAGDGGVWLNVTLDATEVEGDGIFCVDAATLRSMLADKDNQPVTLEANSDNERLDVIFGHSSSFCAITNVDLYPELEQNSDYITFGIESSPLITATRRSMWATEPEDGLRDIMRNVCLNICPLNACDIVASNGRVLICNSAQCLSGYPSPVEIHIPKKVCGMMGDAFNSLEPISVHLSEKSVFLSQGNVEVRFLRSTNKYPNYKAVIPLTFAHTVTITKQDLINALEYCQAFTVRSTRIVKLYFYGDRCDVGAFDYDSGKGATKTIGASPNNPIDMQIGANVSSLLAMLKSTPGRDILLRLNDPTSAFVVNPKEQEGVDFTGLIMPMQITNE